MQVHTYTCTCTHVCVDVCMYVAMYVHRVLLCVYVCRFCSKHGIHKTCRLEKTHLDNAVAIAVDEVL